MKRLGQRNTKVSVFRSPELERAILDGLCAGRSLTKICQTSGFPTAASVVQWATRDPEFRRKYLEARQIGAQLMADALIEESEAEIGCDSMARVQARRLAVDTKKWWLSKVLPGAFGDHVEHHLNTEIRVFLPQKSGPSDHRYPASARLIAGVFEEPDVSSS